MDLGVSGGISRDTILSGGAYGGIVIEPSFKQTWYRCPNVCTNVARLNTGKMPLAIAVSSYTNLNLIKNLKHTHTHHHPQLPDNGSRRRNHEER